MAHLSVHEGGQAHSWIF